MLRTGASARKKQPIRPRLHVFDYTDFKVKFRIMKILRANQIREADAYTIRHEPIASIDLMERASMAFVDWFLMYFEPSLSVSVLAGPGNNGGDGLAIARLLINEGFDVRVWVMSESGSEDFNINYNRLNAELEVKIFDDDTVFDADILIDGLFGSGLTRPPEGRFATAIRAFNRTQGIKIAIDIASGLYCDALSTHDAIVRPDYTVSFQVPKLAFMFPEHGEYTGALQVVEIGLDPDYLHRVQSPYHYLIADFIAPIMGKRPKSSHKGNYGHGAIFSGSHGKLGAAVLCARAFQRSGAGLTTIFGPACGMNVLQSSVPEAMFQRSGEDYVTSALHVTDKHTVVVGPGLGVEEETASVLLELLQRKQPLVIDADGLNIIAAKKWLSEIPPHSILTPHVKEFDRLFGTSDHHPQRLETMKHAAENHDIYILLKGSHTAIATPEGLLFFNATGNPGMATGGTGDVLTGIIGGLLAQGHTPFHAAVLGAFFHGLAGDIAAEELGEQALIASDIIQYLPQAFLRMEEVHLT